MPSSISDLLSASDLHLALINKGLDGHLLNQEITWVHNSDLLDPTPWLEPKQLMLTDGLQFVGTTEPSVFNQYIQRLLASEILGLGFSTNVVHEVVPKPLIEACEKLGLPLFQVPARTPFVAIAQHVARVRAADQRRTLEWSLDAQKALARAALRPDGLPAVLDELERQLKAWVVLFDANGKVLLTNKKVAIPESALEEVQANALKVLSKGMRAAATLNLQSGIAILQTLGHNYQLRGVLVVGGSSPLDEASTEIVESVIAIASIALEQSRQLNAARMNLRNGLLELMLAGSTEIATSSSEKIWGGFPVGRIRVLATTDLQTPKQLEDELELIAEETKGSVFFARRPKGQLILIASDRIHKNFVSKLQERELALGVSSAGDISEIVQLVEQATSASSFTTEERTCVNFEEIYGDGLLAYLNNEGGRVLAAKRLEPLNQLDDSIELLRTLIVWLDANCAWDPAAKELHVHRHTLRNRIRLIEETLRVDLSAASDRFELWSALQLIR